MGVKVANLAEKTGKPIGIMKYFIGLLTLVVVACSAPTQEQPAVEVPTRTFPANLKKGFDAHGGIENWDAFRSLKFDVVREEGNEKQLVDLKSRKVRIETPAYTLGFDGDEVWVTPDSAAFSGNARFYHNLLFYFFALPYLAADPGVNLSEAGKATINGITYDKVLMTFGENVGDSPKDQYVLYFDDQGIMRLINYSVTYFDENRATQYNAIGYEDWVNTNGIMLPQTLVGYVWSNDSLGDVRYRRKFENFELSKEAADQALFAMPAGAYISPK